MLPRPRPDLALVAALATVSLCSALPARAQVEGTLASGGALRLVAEPARLVLGRDGGAELRIAVPADVTELAVTSNVGRIDGLHRVGAGSYAARFRAPAERYPQVALVAAVGHTAQGAAVDGWIAIPLSGQGDARVRAKPGAEIVLRIGDRSFGPRRAGPDGVAVLPVVVPPGVREAHHGFHPVDLRVPDVPLLHAVADRTLVRADRTSEVRILAYVVAPHGAARRGDVPVFEATRGEVIVAAREPGAFEGTWRLPPGPAGAERLVVRLPGAAASRRVLEVEGVAGPPATVAVAFDREALVAGSADELPVSVRVLDAAGNAVHAPVLLESDVGALSEPGERTPGAYEARLRVPPRFRGRTELVVTARVPDAGISGARALRLRPAAPAVARFQAERDVVLADGSREAALRLSVHDRYDNPIALRPAVSAGRGKVVAIAAAEEPGTYLVRYLPPAVEERTDERLEAELDGLRAETELLLVPPRRSLTLAPEAALALDLRGRFVTPAAVVSAELPSDLLPGALSWRAEAGFLGWRRSGEAGPVDRRSAATVTRTDATVTALLAGASLRRETRERLELWASLGGGLALGTADVGAAPARAGLALAARGAAGVGLHLRHGMPFVEVGMLAVSGAPQGAFAAATLALGMRFDLSSFGRDVERGAGAPRTGGR